MCLQVCLWCRVSLKVIDSSVLDASNLLASLPEQKRVGQDIVYEYVGSPIMDDSLSEGLTCLAMLPVSCRMMWHVVM